MSDSTGTRQSTGSILSQLADGDPSDAVDLQTVLNAFGRRAFAVLFLLAALLAMNPVPGLAGGLSGPLVIFAGLQLLFGRRRPWIPQFALRKTVHRSFFIGARDRLGPLLSKVENLILPRYTVLFDKYIWNIVTGVLLVIFGVLVLLPIPFTNFAFGVLLLFYCIAFVERSGVLLLVNWTITIGVIVVFGVLSGSLVAAATEWSQRLFGV